MLPQLDPTWYASQSFWLLITFCATFVVVWRFVMPLMRATVDARQTRLETDLKTAEDLKNQAEALLKQYETAMADVKKQSQTILAKAQEEITASLAQTEKDFDSRLAAHLAEGEQKLEEAKAEALKSVRQIAADLTGEITQKITATVPTAAELTKAIDSVLKENSK